MPIDIQAERAATPACAEAINLNTASSGLLSRAVAERMARHHGDVLRHGHARARAAVRDELQGVRSLAARLIEADSSEIAFTDTATRAWAMGLHALVALAPGRNVLMAQGDWAGNRLNAQLAADRQGAALLSLPNDADGILDVRALDRLLTPDCAAVCLSLLPTSGGRVQPVAAIAARVRAQVPACRILVDASQAVGQMPVSLHGLEADMLVFPARKWLRGPDGVAVLALRQESLAACRPGLLLDREGFALEGRDIVPATRDAARFEGHSFDVAGRLGLGVALAHAMELGLAPIASRVEALAARLRRGLAATPGVALQEPPGASAGIVTCSLDRLSPADAVQALAVRGILAGVSDHRYAGEELRARGLTALLRLSAHYLTEESEIDRALDAIASLAKAQPG